MMPYHGLAILAHSKSSLELKDSEHVSSLDNVNDACNAEETSPFHRNAPLGQT